jgi:hypothetical protein
MKEMKISKPYTFCMTYYVSPPLESKLYKG